MRVGSVELDEKAMEFAHRMFDLARDGGATDPAQATRRRRPRRKFSGFPDMAALL